MTATLWVSMPERLRVSLVARRSLALAHATAAFDRLLTESVDPTGKRVAEAMTPAESVEVPHE